MALTRITKGVIKPNENYDTHNIVSTGIVTSVGLDVNGNADVSGSLSVGGVLTYEDVTSIDSVGIITAQKDIHVGAGVSAVGVGTFGGLDINGDIDVDGHTNLDNVSIAGVVTVTGNVTAHDFLPDTNSFRNIGTSSKKFNQVHANTFYGSGAALTGIDATAIKDSGGNVKIQAQASGAVYTGIHTFNSDLDVDGHTNLDNVSIAGVTTAAGNVNMGGGNLIFGDSGGDSDDKLVFGAGSDFKIFHNGSNNYIDVAGNGHLYIRPKANFYIQDYTNGEVWIDGALNGGVQLYNNGSLKLATDGNGITVQGNINMATDSTLQLGAGNDFKLFHNGTTNYIRSNNGNIQIDNNSGVPNALFIPGQGTRLYYGAAVKFTTETSGVNITGIVTATSADINGDLDVDGHTNLDNVSIAGVTTMTGNLTINSSSSSKAIILPDNKRIYFGDGEDMWIGSNGSNGEVSGVLYHYNHVYFYDNVLARFGNGSDLMISHNGTDSSIDNDTGKLYIDSADDIIFRTNPSTEALRITSAGKLTMSSGTVELQSHMVRVGNRTTAQINAGVSTSTGALTLDTTTNSLKYYANATWKVVKQQANDGSSQNFAARSAKALLDDGITSNGVYWLNMHGAYSSGNAKLHYCLQDTSYDGGGWTMLYSMNHGNNFASGSNYSFSLNVGSPTSINDFTAGNWGYDRRNTFTPAANDQFLIRRSDNNDWKRFVVSNWSPTANSVSNGWETLNRPSGSNTGHPYWAEGQMYDASGNSVSGHTHFNGCAKGGNCNSGGGDGSGFGNFSQWLDCVGNSGFGGGYNSQSNGGSPLYWGQNNALSQGGSLYIQMFYRKAGTQ